MIRRLHSPDLGRVQELEPMLLSWGTLEHAVLWALPKAVSIDVIEMDEYSHNVVLSVSEDLVIVLDTT